MSWVKLDDRFYSHPKALAAGLRGRGLFLASLCWCKANLTDGFIPSHALPMLAVQAGVPAGTTAVHLVKVGLWEIDADGWRVHDWRQWNEQTAEEQKAQKAAHAEKMRALRAKWKQERAEARAMARGAPVPSPYTDTDTDTEVVPSSSLSKGTVVAAEEWRERDLPDEPTRLRVNGWNL